MYSPCRSRGMPPIGSPLRMSSHEAGALIGALALPSARNGGSASATASSSSGDTAPAPVHTRHYGSHFQVSDGTCAEQELWHVQPLSPPWHVADR